MRMLSVLLVLSASCSSSSNNLGDSNAPPPEECNVDADCRDSGGADYPFSDPSKVECLVLDGVNTCVECLESSDCAGGLVCSAGIKACYDPGEQADAGT